MAEENVIEKDKVITENKYSVMYKNILFYVQKIISGFVILFCFVLFPAYLLYSSLNAFFESKCDSIRQLEQVEMGNVIQFLNKYSNNKRYFHFLFTKISEYAQNSKDPIKYIERNINNLKEKYPNKFEFVVWDDKGKVVSHLSNKNGFNYVMNKLYESLKEVTNILKSDYSFRISNLESIKKNINIFRSFMGKIFIPENLKFPLGNNFNSGPLLTELGHGLTSVWFSIKEKVSFLCFISDDLLADFSGIDKITRRLNSKKSDIITGFSVTPNYSKPISNFPKRYAHDLSLALTTFENAGDSFFENDKAIVKMSMPQPALRTFCFLPKINEDWNYEYKRNFWFGILISVLLAIYCFLGFWFLYKRHFFSIRWKLTALFLFANFAPIFILGFIAKGYLESKRLSLKNEIVGELEKSLREVDARYNSIKTEYSLLLNSEIADISKKIGDGPIEEDEKIILEQLYNKYNCSEIYIIASDSKIISFNNRDKFNNNQNIKYRASVLEAVLAYLNNHFNDNLKTDIFSSLLNAEDSEFIRMYLKNLGQVSELLIGEDSRIYFSETFGNKKNYHNNYILELIWDKEVLQNIFLEKYFVELCNTFPDTEFYIKSNYGKYTYGSKKLLNNVSSILEKNSNITEKNDGYTIIDNKKYIYVCLNGTNLKEWVLLAFYPEDRINREINLIIVQFIIGAFFSLLLTIIIGHVLSLQFLKPLHNLGNATMAIGERNFSYRIPIGDKDEFGHLNLVFNRVIEGLGDFEVARIVQESLFPGNHFDVGNFKIFGRSVVMTTLGGDYYDCFKINDEYQGIIIGDVAGHGIPAGLMMAMAKSSVLTASEETKLDPAALTIRLHQMFFAIKNKRLKRMMTFQYYVLRVSDGHFIYTNAGHCYPLIVDNNAKTAKFIEYIATPLGIGSKCRCKNQEFNLEKGQSLVLYTDGIVEANNAVGEQYGYERYKECLPKHYDADPEKFYYNLYDKVYKKWSPKPDDDLTLIIVNRN